MPIKDEKKKKEAQQRADAKRGPEKEGESLER